MPIIVGMSSTTNRLRDLRLARQLSQEQLSDLSGVDQAHISKLESGLIDNPSYRTVSNIARVLGVTTDALMVGPLGRDQRRAERRTGVPRRQGEKRSGLDRRNQVA